MSWPAWVVIVAGVFCGQAAMHGHGCVFFFEDIVFILTFLSMIMMILRIWHVINS